MDDKHILNLIESAPAKDNTVYTDYNYHKYLDEIDAQVDCFLKEKIFLEIENYKSDGMNSSGTIVSKCPSNCGVKYYAGYGSGTFPRFSRSRDALKAIRPEGWQYKMTECGGSKTWQCSLIKFKERCEIEKTFFNGWNCELTTEELAELYVTIQAISWERKQAKKEIKNDT